ncbi:hypothetical protein KAU09_02385 [Candidatus Parcubacteria bacterium]|nr:hypothetical protein [Candidatus Parcubacteria bacterium]
MFKKTIHFIKYNNAALLILLAIFAIGSGAWAQTEAGREFIGEKQEKIEGTDNTLLLSVDMEEYDMDFKIERIKENDKYYFVAYTYLDLAKIDNVWEYQLNEKIRKISKKIKKDLGAYLAEELKEEYDARIKALKKEREIAAEKGEETRIEVADYSGLIGKTLKLTEKIFSGYESVKKREIPSPAVPATVLAKRKIKEQTSEESEGEPDDLTKVYFDYLEKMKNDAAEESVAIEEPVVDIPADEDISEEDNIGENLAGDEESSYAEATEDKTEDELLKLIEDGVSETESGLTESVEEIIKDEPLPDEKETPAPAEELDVEIMELPIEDN